MIAALLLIAATAAAQDSAPAATPPPVEQSAADCAHPADATDQLVCSTPALLALDRQMAALLPRVGTIDAKLVEPQSDWFKRRSSCAMHETHLACASDAYRERIAVLQALADPPAPGRPAFPCRFPDAGILQVAQGEPVTLLRDATGKVQGVALARDKRSKWYPYLRILDSAGQLRFVLGKDTNYCDRS